VALILELKIKVATQNAHCGLSSKSPFSGFPFSALCPTRITRRMSNVSKC